MQKRPTKKKIKKELTMSTRSKSTAEVFMESLSEQQLREYSTDYIKLSINELLHETIQKNNISVPQLSMLSGVSSESIREILKETKEEISMNDVIALLQGLGYTFFVEKDGQAISLDTSL